MLRSMSDIARGVIASRTETLERFGWRRTRHRDERMASFRARHPGSGARIPAHIRRCNDVPAASRDLEVSVTRRIGPAPAPVSAPRPAAPGHAR
jgi:hypothetical protein